MNGGPIPNRTHIRRSDGEGTLSVTSALGLALQRAPSSRGLNLNRSAHAAVAMDPDLLLDLGRREGEEVAWWSRGEKGWGAGCEGGRWLTASRRGSVETAAATAETSAAEISTGGLDVDWIARSSRLGFGLWEIRGRCTYL